MVTISPLAAVLFFLLVTAIAEVAAREPLTRTQVRLEALAACSP